MRDLLLKIRYDATNIQAKVTDLLNQYDELGLEPRAESPSDRAFLLAYGEILKNWWQLADLQLETEIDLLGIPHVDRQPLYDLANTKRKAAGMSSDASAAIPEREQLDVGNS